MPKSVHLNHPERGLRMIYNRLEECNSSPELRVHFSNELMTSLGILEVKRIMELQSASSAKTSLNPFSRQEKWLFLDFSYK